MFTSRGVGPIPRSLRTTTRSLVRALGLVCALVFISDSARAGDTSSDMNMTYGQFAKMDPMKAMKMMDRDNKGYVTKEEFLKFQEKLFSNIPKQNPDRITMEEWRKAYQNTGQ